MPDRLLARYGGEALITGASAGLGACYAEALARRGFPLVLTARREDRLRELAARLEAAHGVRVQVVPLDLAAPGGPDRLADAVKNRDLGILVNNAGFGFNGSFLEGDADRYEEMIALNCVAPARLTRRLLPGLLARGRGAILMLASTASFQPVPYLTVYGATKAFDLMLGEGLAAELRGTGVDVLSVCPGVTRTEFQRVARMTEETRGADPARVVEGSLGRLGRRLTFVHGLHNLMGTIAVRLVPRALTARIAGAILPRVLFRSSARAYRARLLERATRDPNPSEKEDHD